MTKIDLVSIGSGPAGISTALHLLQLDPGWAGRMIVLEKETHPRHKLCAGGVTRFGLDVLRGLGLRDPFPVPHVSVDDAHLIYDGRVIHMRRKPEFLVFQRAEFDACMAEEARRRGVKVLENTPVLGIEPRPDGIAIRTESTTYLAEVVVGADGSKGLTRRLVGSDSNRRRVARLLEVVRPAEESAPQFQKTFARFDFTPSRADLQGYTWDFPSFVGGEPRFNRGVYDARLDERRARAGLPDVLEQSLHDWGDNGDGLKLQGHPIHWFSPRGRFSAPRLLLVGDAAGADPLFGEGIGPALGYGKVAAQTLAGAFEQKRFEFRGYKRRVLASPVGRYLLLRWAVAWWSYRLNHKARFMHALWSLGEAIGRLGRLLDRNSGRKVRPTG